MREMLNKSVKVVMKITLMYNVFNYHVQKKLHMQYLLKVNGLAGKLIFIQHILFILYGFFFLSIKIYLCTPYFGKNSGNK